jgi:hypothetical protein
MRLGHIFVYNKMCLQLMVSPGHALQGIYNYPFPKKDHSAFWNCLEGQKYTVTGMIEWVTLSIIFC